MALSLSSTLDLGHGVAMPALGLGTYKSAPGAEVERSVEFALRTGYRGIDTASMYGNEESIGAALRASGVPRDEVFLATKVWNDEQGHEGTRAALERSLARLGVEHVDLYLVHWPQKEHTETTWRAMEDLLAEGKTRAIGVCNHLQHHLERLLAVAKVPPAVDQVEFHPWLQQPGLQAYLAEHDITLQAWAPVMRGHTHEEPALVEVAEKYGVTPEQVAIRWVLEQGYSAIPKSVHEERIRENAELFGFALSEEDVARIAAADRNERLGRDPNIYE